jgi:uncharacterized metal-binding protein
MDCTSCIKKECRNNNDCQRHDLVKEDILQEYHKKDVQQIIRNAGLLVDNGRAGMLSRLAEIIDFIKNMGYRKVGLAYCYGMEKEAQSVAAHLKEKDINLINVACTIGSFKQNELNKNSELSGVSCNPIGQASQLNNEGVDFVLLMGLCLGHDILFHRYLKADFTTLVVKDRVHQHAPLKALG